MSTASTTRDRVLRGRPLWRPALLVAIGSVFLAVVAPVLHQEAYYTLFAHHPALSYFDHPPMVAWLIWIGTALLGDGALGVRIMTLVCGLAFALAGFGLLARFGGGAWARSGWLLLLAGVPFFAGGRIIATPDAPLCCFWALTIVALWDVRRAGSIRGWVLVGACAGGALLSKYTAGFLGLGVVILLLLDPSLRRQLTTPGPWLGLGVAAACFAPVVIWNWQHDWASFLYQTHGRGVDHGIRPRWALQLALGQFFGLTPMVAVGFVAAAIWSLRRWLSGDVRGLWVLAFSAPLIVAFGSVSLWLHVKLNWMMPAWFTLAIGMLVWVDDGSVRARFPRAVAAGRSIVLAHAWLVLLSPLAWLTPARHSNSWSGWTSVAACAERLEEQLDSEDGTEGDVFFFATTYEDAGQLEFRLRQLHREASALEPVGAENILGRIGRQFDHWCPPEQHLGRDAILVARRPGGDTLSPQVHHAGLRFDSIEEVERVETRMFGILVQSVDIYVCRGYRGPRTDG